MWTRKAHSGRFIVADNRAVLAPLLLMMAVYLVYAWDRAVVPVTSFSGLLRDQQ